MLIPNDLGCVQLLHVGSLEISWHRPGKHGKAEWIVRLEKRLRIPLKWQCKDGRGCRWLLLYCYCDLLPGFCIWDQVVQGGLCLRCYQRGTVSSCSASGRCSTCITLHYVPHIHGTEWIPLSCALPHQGRFPEEWSLFHLKQHSSKLWTSHCLCPEVALPSHQESFPSSEVTQDTLQPFWASLWASNKLAPKRHFRSLCYFMKQWKNCLGGNLPFLFLYSTTLGWNASTAWVCVENKGFLE